jgi:hypothetical protein
MVVLIAVLNAIAGLAVAIATFRLVGITRRYVEHTKAMVDEMCASRRAQLRPRLVPVFAHAGPPAGRGNIFVMNVGEGTALDIDVTLHLAPNGARSQLVSPMLRSGEKRIWNPTLDGSAGAEDHPFFPDATPGRTHLHLTGRCRDVEGVWHTVDETTPLRDAWQVFLNINVPQP